MNRPPVACQLTEPELRQRRATVLAEFKAAGLETRELPQGFAFRLPVERLPLLATVIDLERRCCPFLRFQLTVEEGSSSAWLELTGPAGTKEILITELQLVER